MEFKYKTTEDKINKGIELIINNGGKFYTDWTFSVKGVEGEISFKNGILNINITDKPWLASWSMIEKELDNFFN